MQCNSTDLLEVLTIVSQYESHAEVYDVDGLLHIDGLRSSRQMTKYERSVLNRLGFETGEEFGIRQIPGKEEKK